MTELKAIDVFTPNKPPNVTYVDDLLLDRADQLNDALDSGSTLISISGPSKSGKTVFVEKMIGSDLLIRVTCAGVKDEITIWDRILDQLNTPVTYKKTETYGKKTNISGSIKGDIGILKGEVGVGAGQNDGTSVASEYSVDFLQLIIKELGGTNFVVFLDDFHYLPNDVQVSISGQIKEAISQKVKIICATVPYRSTDVIRANRDLRGRLVTIDFDYWDAAQLRKIAEKGFEALNVQLTDAMISALVHESAGSPQLMQTLCLRTCNSAKIRNNSGDAVEIKAGLELIKNVCKRAASAASYADTFKKMVDGPKIIKGKRQSFLLKDGGITDIYSLVLKGMSLNPPSLIIRYNNLITRIGDLCDDNVPSATLITSACEELQIITNEAEGDEVLVWDSDNDILEIRDPYLLFYLRWGAAYS